MSKRTSGRHVFLIGCAFLTISFSALSSDSESSSNTMIIEINHLLDYVRNTDCKYERNGDYHNGVDAVEHIQKKYDYFEEEIETTEDFIRLSATKSTMSGKAYNIHCPGEPAVPSAQWLKDELNRFRNL